MDQQMKAFVRTSSTDQNIELQNVQIPEFGPEEVLIKVEAFGVGIHDGYFIPSDAKFPYIIGSEGAGIIEQKGSKVKNFDIGDPVIYTTSLQKQGGTWAEYTVAKQNVLIKLPEKLTFQEGAALPISGKTALECMREIDLNRGDTLFIAGASGAIGTMVIQLAKAQGIRISASASQKNHDYMTSLGANQTVDYHDPDWINKVKEWSDGGVTAALAIQPGTGADSIKVVKDNGRLITVSGDSTSVTPERGISVNQMEHHLDTPDLEKFVQDVAREKIKLVIEDKYDFEDSLQALKKTETRHARGKIVVSLS